MTFFVDNLIASISYLNSPVRNTEYSFIVHIILR